MTDKEREVLELLVKHGSLKVAAAESGISQNTLNQRLVRMRIKESRYRAWLKHLDQFKLQLPTRYLE